MKKSKRIVIDNLTILEGREFEKINGYVVVENGKIKEIGEGSYRGANKIDGKRCIAFPSFTNAHVHLGDAAAKDFGAYKSIGERVGKNGIKFRALNSEKNEKITDAMSYALKEMLSNGTTAFCDFRESGVKGIKILKKALDSIGEHEFSPVILGRPEGNKENIEFLSHCNGFGISGLKDYSPEFIKKALKKRADKMIAVHCSETKDDVDDVLKIAPDFVVHLTNASESSLEKIFARRIPIVLCPRANASFGAGIPDLRKIFSDGAKRCKIGIGTDNVMANSLSMFRELEFIFKLYRGLYKDYEFNAKALLRAATFEGREILGLKSNAIEEGNPADFAMLKRGKYIYDEVLSIVHRVEAGDIKAILKNSAILKR